MSLPTAQIEEAFCPDHVVAVDNMDGSVDLIMYVGPLPQEAGGGYVFVKHARIKAEHAQAMFKGISGPPEPTQDAPRTRAVASLAECYCGSVIMPNGLCAQGHVQ